MSEEYKPEQNGEEKPETTAGPEISEAHEASETHETERPTISFQMIQGKPIVTYLMIAVTAVVFLLQQLSRSRYGIDWPMAYGAKINRYITYGHQYWRLITPILLHADIMHILFNMYALFSLGPALERYYGHWNFLRFYLISGFAGNVLSYIASPNSVSVGASTAIFGLIGAQAMFLYKNRRLLRNYKSALQNIGFVIVVNLLLGLRGGVDNWGHLGGLLGGGLLAWLCGPEIGFTFDPNTQHAEMVDTVPRSRREISCLLVTLFLAAAAFALGR